MRVWPAWRAFAPAASRYFAYATQSASLLSLSSGVAPEPKYLTPMTLLSAMIWSTFCGSGRVADVDVATGRLQVVLVEEVAVLLRRQAAELERLDVAVAVGAQLREDLFGPLDRGRAGVEPDVLGERPELDADLLRGDAGATVALLAPRHGGVGDACAQADGERGGDEPAGE